MMLGLPVLAFLGMEVGLGVFAGGGAMIFASIPGITGNEPTTALFGFFLLAVVGGPTLVLCSYRAWVVWARDAADDDLPPPPTSTVAGDTL
jgi:hypothetical protein